MKRIFTVLILLLSFYIQSHAQTLNNQCESSPCNALPICGPIVSQPYAFTSGGNPPGTPLPVTSCINNLGTSTTVTSNWVFYRFTCYSAGDLNFLITPNQTLTNLNWALWDITTSGCGNLNTGNVVECNFNTSSTALNFGTTGCGITTSAIIEPTLTLNAGTYILGVQRAGSGGTITTGFTIDFTGTTADISETTPPALATVLPITTCGPVTSIKVLTTKPVKCAQIAAADFTVPGATVATATTNNCPGCVNSNLSPLPANINSNYSNVKDTITLNFATALSAGNHTLSLTANGVFSDICGNLASNASTVLFNVPTYLNDSIKQGYNCATQTYIDTIWGTGGTAPYQYKITTNTTSPPPPANNGIYGAATSSYGVFSGLYGGVTYTLAVLDANGCKDSTIITPAAIIPLGSPNLSASQIVSPPCYNQFNLDTIYATINSSTGVGPYTWSLASSPAGVASTGTSTSAVGNFRKWYGLSGFTSSATFTVTVKDSYGCTKTGGATLINPSQLVLPTLTGTNPLCFGDSSGTITCNNTFASLGGTPAYTYVINPSFSNTFQSGPSFNVFNNLPGTPTPGIIYTVTVQDSKGCTATNTKAITSNAAIVIKTVNTTLPVTFVNPNCVTPCGGWIKPTASGGQGSKKFYLYNTTMTGFIDSTNNTNTPVPGTLSGLCPGTYTVMAKDAAGCTATATYTLALPPIPDLVQDSLTNVLCFGACTGKAFTTTIGGTSPFTYAITPNNNAPCGNAVAGTGVNVGDYSNLPTGNYKIIVTSGAATTLGGGCKDSVSFFINQPPSAVAITAVTKDSVQCFGQNNGLINVIASGGTGTITYKITPLGPQTNITGNFTGLTAQCYTVTATDANGCSTTSSVCVYQPIVVNATSTKLSDVSCFGLCDGTGKVKPTGGNGNFTYLVTGGSGTPLYNTTGDSCMISNLCAGTYTILSTDSKGCTKTTTLTISQPTVITTVKSQVNVSCFGQCTGTATVTPSGGMGGFYNYFITSSPLGSTPTINPSGTVGALANLCSGTYIVQTKDSNACTKIDTFIITQPATALTATVSQGLTITCNSLCNATGTVTPSGGTPNFSYLILNATGNVNSSGVLGNLTNLCADTYTVNVTDSKSCTTSVTLTITQPPPLVINTALSDSIACFGLITGAVHYNVTGGTGSITYKIQPGNITNTTGNFTGLVAGCYTVTATDANLCSITSSICIGQPLLLTASSFKLADATCNGYCDGSGSVTPLNGNGNYTYIVSAPASATILPIYNNSGNVCNLSSLCAGTYTINVTDSKGCTTSTTLLISQPNSVVPNYSIVQTPTCTPGCDGQAQVSAIGGNGIYTYVSITPTTASISATGLATGLCAGTAYTIIVNDGNSCSGSVVINLSTPAGPSALNIVTQTNPSCLPGCDGSATVLAVGGAGTITYSIQSPVGSTCTPTQAISGTFNNLGIGIYTVIAADANNCTKSNTFTLVNPLAAPISVSSTTNATCNPGCDGTATMSNVPNMVYAISPLVIPAIVGNNISGLCSGIIYTITGTSSVNGCTSTTTVTIGTLSAPAAPTVTSSTLASCFPGCDGTTVFNSAVALTYSFSPFGPVATGNNVTGLCAGTTYTVTGADAAGCIVQTTISIGVSPNPAAPTSVVTSNASCNPGCDGVVTMSPSTGLLYTVTPGGTVLGNVISALCNGTIYTVTGTDNKGCTATATISVGQQTAPAVSVLSTTNATCSPGCDGTATMNNVPNMVYTISPLVIPAIVGNNIGGLCSGVLYTITGTSSVNGCTSTTTVQVGTLNGPAAPTVTSSTLASCFPGCDGTTVFSSAVALTYSFSPIGPIAIGNNVSGLCAGTTYTVTGADAAGCTVVTTIQVGVSPNPAAPTSVVTTNASCNPGCDGVVTMSPAIGLVYTVSPSPSIAPLGNVIGGLCVGTTYTVTGTDNKGCTATATISVGQQTAPAISVLSTTNATCNPGCDGVVTMNNVPNMVYTISPSVIPAILGNNIGGLCSGVLYTITGTSSVNGCTSTTTVQVGTLNGPTLSITSQINASCVPGCDGSAIVNPSVPLTYTFSPIGPIAIGNNVSGLCAGTTYTVTGSDVAGCTVQITIQVSTPNALPISVLSTTNASCNPGCDGTAIMTNVAGMSYTITPSVIPAVVGNTISGLCSGLLYTIKGTDAAGCTTTTTVQIGTTPSPTVSVTGSTNVTISGLTNGTLTVLGAGGTPGYTYSISPLSPGTITQLPIGKFNGLDTLCYTIQVTDSKGCTGLTTQCISSPPPSSCIFSKTDETCFGLNNGTITAINTGGVPPYTVTVNGSSTLTGLVPTNYLVVITDANGGSCSSNLTIAAGTQITMNAPVIAAPTCIPGCDGTIAITANSTTGTAITYQITPPAGSTCNTTQTSTGVFTNVGVGTYIIKATDINGCSSTTNVIITPPGSPVIDSIKKSNLSCNNFCNGKITVYATGVGYTYSKNNGISFQNSNVFDSLCIGTYTIIVKSSFNCTVSTLVTLTQPSPVVQVTSSFSSPSCYNQNNGTITFIASGGTGVIVDTITPNPIGSTQFPAGTFINLPAGSYTVTARDSNLCAIINTYTLVNPPILAWDATSFTNITCNGANNGKINVSVLGGTNPITYTINGSTGTSPFNNLTANIYTIQATDAKGCTITTSFTIVEPPAIVYNLPIVTNNICFGGSDGIINITANGGVPGYFYTLNPNNAAPNATGIFNSLPTLPLPQVYTVTVVDASGCSKTTTVSLSQPPALVFTPISVQNVACFGGNTGTITAIANGGAGLLTNSNYTILPTGSGVQSSPGFYTGLTAGSYIIIVKDANNCVVSTAVTVTQNPPIEILSFTSTEPICKGDANGSLSIVAFGGVSPYVYYLDGGTSNSSGTFTGLVAKFYTITIQDALGCTKDTLVQVKEPTAVGARLVTSDANCIDSKDGKLFVVGIGGRGGYKYYVTPGLNINKSGIFSGLEAGTYTLRVVDTVGCDYIEIFTINPPSNPLNNVITKQDLGCTGKGNEGQATANVSGGAPPYTYVWFTNPAQTTQIATQLYFGSYNLQVTDAKGCVIYDTVEIEAGPCCEIAFIPNAFSPNGDGKNDVFRILSTAAIQVQQLDIYDRWGKRVWSTIDYRRGWDGTVDGEQAPLATYQYIFRYKCLTDNATYTKKGDVILIR